MTDTATTLFINGSWEAAASGAVREIRNPADGELVATVSEAGRADAERAISAARAAFDSGVWSSVPAPERGTFLLKVAAGLRERREKFARAESLDTGKRMVESRIDMDDIAASFEYFGRLAGRQAGRVRRCPRDPQPRRQRTGGHGLRGRPGRRRTRHCRGPGRLRLRRLVLRPGTRTRDLPP